MCALKGPDISSELSILELLHGSDLNALPLFTHHLCAHSPAGLPFTHVAAAAAAAAAPAPLPKPPPPSSKQQLGPASTPGREPGEDDSNPFCLLSGVSWPGSWHQHTCVKAEVQQGHWDVRVWEGRWTDVTCVLPAEAVVRPCSKQPVVPR